MLDRRHELFRLAGLIEWEGFDAAFGRFYRELGRPGKATRLMVGLSYLKHVYDLSDEQVVARWVENPYWQWFCGDEYFQHEAPIDPSLLTRWRQRIGPQGMEKLLAETRPLRTAEGLIGLRNRLGQNIRICKEWSFSARNLAKTITSKSQNLSLNQQTIGF